MIPQALEPRCHFAITHGLDAAGTLTVQGDYANDVITVQEDRGYLVVSQATPDLNWNPLVLSIATGSRTLLRSPLLYAPPPGGYALAAVKRIVINGGPGADLITVNSSLPAEVHGDTGVDTVYGGAGNDRVDGGIDNDSLFGRWGDDALGGGAGDDGIWGGDGDDVLDGSVGDDSLWGGPGNDAMAGGDGADSFFGEDGNEAFLAEPGADFYSGGPGRDSISYAARSAPIHINPRDGLATDGETGEGDNIQSDVEDFTGGWGNDSISGTDDDNLINGGDGDDWLFGFGGNDYLIGGDGHDWIMDRGTSSSPGMAPDNDVLDGGNGDDLLQAGDGNDILLGGNGTDRMTDDGVGTDYYDGGPSGAYRDQLWYTFRTEDLRLSADGIANDGAPGENDQILGCEMIGGGRGNDLIIAGNDASYDLWGSDGDDTLVGGTWSDILDGGDGNDVFYAGDGRRDKIDGGAGFDVAVIDKHWFFGFAIADEDLLDVESW